MEPISCLFAVLVFSLILAKFAGLNVWELIVNIGASQFRSGVSHHEPDIDDSSDEPKS